MGTTHLGSVDVTGEVLVNGVAVNTGATTSVTPGTVAASKAVIVDANKDITGLRNVTTTGATVLGDAVGDTVLMHGAATSGAQSALAVSPTAPGVAYVQAEAASAKTAIDAVITCLRNHGLMANA